MSGKTKYFNSDTFCAMPFVGLNVLSGGNISYCCFSEEQLIDKDEPLTIDNSTLTRAWNSTSIKQIRKDMIEGKAIPACARCTKQEEYSQQGPRNSMTNEWFNRIGRRGMIQLLQEAKSNDYALSNDPVYLDLRLGNLCNIKCRMCNPWNSSQIDKENGELWLKDKNYRDVWMEEYGGLPENLEEIQPWFEADILWDDVIKFIPNLLKVYFTGGEPTLIQGNMRFLQECIDQDRKDLVPFFNTNCTNRNKKFTNLISQFDKVDINGSLDGVGPMNDYIRYPSKWSAVTKNFEKYASLKNIHLGISPVFQVYNIFNTVELMKYIEEQKVIHDRPIHIDWLLNTHPVMLKAEILPYSIREKAHKKLNDYYQSLDKSKLDNITIASTERVLNYMIESKDHNDEKLQSFIHYTNSLDKHRKQKFKDSCPELYKHLYEYNSKLFNND